MSIWLGYNETIKNLMQDGLSRPQSVALLIQLFGEGNISFPNIGTGTLAFGSKQGEKQYKSVVSPISPENIVPNTNPLQPLFNNCSC
jgi:hypothetical protein